MNKKIIAHINSNARRRININTAVILTLAILFGAITFCYSSSMLASGKLMHKISNSPAICFDDKEDADGGEWTENEFVCTLTLDENGNNVPVTDMKDYALFFYDNETLINDINAQLSAEMTAMIGGFFTIATLVGAIVYHNHAIAMLEK